MMTIQLPALFPVFASRSLGHFLSVLQGLVPIRQEKTRAGFPVVGSTAVLSAGDGHDGLRLRIDGTGPGWGGASRDGGAASWDAVVLEEGDPTIRGAVGTLTSTEFGLENRYSIAVTKAAERRKLQIADGRRGTDELLRGPGTRKVLAPSIDEPGLGTRDRQKRQIATTEPLLR